MGVDGHTGISSSAPGLGVKTLEILQAAWIRRLDTGIQDKHGGMFKALYLFA